MQDWLRSHKVSVLIDNKRELTEVAASDTFDVAFKRLIDAGVLSAPVHDANGKYVGFLDVRDLVSLTLAVFQSTETISETKSLDQLAAKVWSHLKQGNAGMSLTYLARRNPFLSLPSDATLFDVAQLLFKLRTTRVHRIAVVDKDTNKVVAVVSQMSLVSFIATHTGVTAKNKEKVNPTLQALLDTPLRKARIGTYPCITCNDSAPAVKAFELLAAHNIGGLAVTRDNGVLVSNVSAKDIKRFLKSLKMSDLQLPLGEFLAAQRIDIDIQMPGISVDLDATIQTVIEKLAGARVHRLYTVNAQNHPVGVVSLTNILQYLFFDIL